ncbi:unnamed protein product [Acanthosepion pharaonis]|uniref:Uncharacterized protein n=1 Tax=Acanthosepion pharaonis TaxID=158019 RepID=A0A812DH86_ACAPH|nr:unnamed protein product [Sepia pharaonis]
MTPGCSRIPSHRDQPPVPHTETAFFHEPLQSFLPYHRQLAKKQIFLLAINQNYICPQSRQNNPPLVGVASTNTVHFFEPSELVFYLVSLTIGFRKAILHRGKPLDNLVTGISFQKKDPAGDCGIPPGRDIPTTYRLLSYASLSLNHHNISSWSGVS